MKKKDKRKYLQMLELGDKASRDDIENAYSHFVKLYSSGDSPEIHPLMEEIDIDERKKILAGIDKAYKALVGEDAVNRMEFTAEFEPQEINLEEEEAATIEQEEIIEHSKENDEEPVVEFVEHEDPIVELPIEEEAGQLEENEEPVVEISERDISGSEIELPLKEEVGQLEEDEEPVVETQKNETFENGARGEIEIEFPLEEMGSGSEESEEPVVETPGNEVPESEITDGIEIEIPLEENGSEAIESEEPIFEISRSEESGKEISIEVEHMNDDNSFIKNENIIEEHIEKIEEFEEITGKYLKKKREGRGVKVREVASILGISYKDIVNIENEKFDKLSDAGYLRWLIKAYAKYLELDETRSAEDYMKRYRQKK